RRDLRLGLLRFATLADQLVNRRHEALHLSLPERPAVTLLNRKSAEPKQHHGRLATRMLSNVQLLPGASETQDARTGGHIATVPRTVSRERTPCSIGAPAPSTSGLGFGLGFTGAGSPPGGRRRGRR